MLSKSLSIIPIQIKPAPSVDGRVGGVEVACQRVQQGQVTHGPARSTRGQPFHDVRLEQLQGRGEVMQV